MVRIPKGVYQVACVLTLILPIMAIAQARSIEDWDEAAEHLGYPEDWSSHHLVMGGDSAEKAIASGVREPRVIYNMVMRRSAIAIAKHSLANPRPTKLDWAVSLESGFVPSGKFPAKYRFDLNHEDCNADFVLFALNAPTSQANIVGINNLYTEATPKCNGGSPQVAFAYNAQSNNGNIYISPTLSSDGTKVAFVESTNNQSYFHVLVLPNPIPTPGHTVGTVRSPQTPTSCSSPTTPGCMTSVRIVNSQDTNSSVWVDYASDTAYVGMDNGKLYKIKPVFKGGAPVIISDANWPVTVSTTTNRILTDPIVDASANRLFIGDGFGYLYAVSLSAPGQTYSARAIVGWVGNGAGTGVVDPPILAFDPANPTVHQVFAFTGCSNVIGIGGAVSQMPVNFTGTNYTGYTAVNLGSGSGNGDCTTGNVHAGFFDNQFFNTGSSGGHIIACGFQSGTPANPKKPSNPVMYMFGFNATTHVMNTTPTTTFTINATTGEECSPLTEFFDGTTDRLFFGVGGTANAFIESSKITGTLAAPTCGTSPTSTCVKVAPALGGTSGITIDNLVANGGRNIYFVPLGKGSVNGGNCKVTGGTATPYCAVKLTQAGLQ
jgi:hypothetical protein